MKIFLEECLEWKHVTEYEMAAVSLLLYHSFGGSKKKPIDKSAFIYRQIGDEGIIKYKKIFDNNNKELVNQFFNDAIIIKLWPVVLKCMTKDMCF